MHGSMREATLGLSQLTPVVHLRGQTQLLQRTGHCSVAIPRKPLIWIFGGRDNASGALLGDLFLLDLEM